MLDVEVELLLTEVRKELLLGSPDRLWAPGVRELTCALIQQCNINEFVFYVSDAEKERLSQIAFSMRELASRQKEYATLAMLGALYAPIHLILADPTQSIHYETLFPEGIGDYLHSQVRQDEESRLLAETIDAFGAIEDEVSRKVRAQYEANPYPRWINKPSAPIGSRVAHVKAYFSGVDLTFLQQPFNVLVAGCGTGWQALLCALGYGRNANVIAIDLSRASLAYAQLMARKFDVSNIRFIQADILDVPRRGWRFDIVESTGVLHHMEDPFKGFSAVVDSLRPHGLLHCSLYSELGRRAITRLRKDLTLRGSIADDDYVRRCRRELVLAHDPSKIWRREDPFPFARDFFSLSNCRDLLFHVNEHVFTIPKIQEYLTRLGLEFRGFVPPPLFAHRYWSRFPSLTDLDDWWELEQANPDTFADLYDFWCLKR